MPAKTTLKIPVLAVLGLIPLLAACSLGGASATQTPALPAATPTPAGPETLNICVAQEPQSLYLYGDNSEAARAIRQAIYDGPIDKVNYQPHASILEDVPSLENGGLVVQTVAVNAGDKIVDANGLVTLLQSGTRVRPAGCRDGNCAVAYEGGELSLEQVVATFQLREGITWSDGTPLTASDSVYSFELAGDVATPGSKTEIQRTASYLASAEHTVVWIGLPGYINSGAQTNFWSPLPRHAWESTQPAELTSAELASRTPLGWGAYVLTEWVAGERISLTRNPNYWRAGEGLPYFSNLDFLFLGGAQAVDALASGGCDVLLPSAELDGEWERLQGMAESGQAQLLFGEAGSWEHLDFAIQPASSEDGFNVFNDGADFFSDLRMRQAFAQCVDRQALIDEFAFGHGLRTSSYLPADHPLFNGGAAAHAFDPTAANALLDELGWVPGADGVRVAAGFPGALNDTRLEISLTTADDARSLAIALSLQNSLDDCGIALLIDSRPGEQVFATGPDGPLFGRQFQLAQFAWPYGQQPSCYLYLSEAIPGEDFEDHRYGWGGWNLSGWSNPEFDAACQRAGSSLPGESVYAESHSQAQALFAEQLPALPLFANMRLAAARPDFCNFALEPGSELLSNLEMLAFAEWCN